MSKKQKGSKGAYASLSGGKRAVPIVLFALALFIGLCFLTPDDVGLGKYVGGFLLGLFSSGAYLIPFLLAIHAVFYPTDVMKKRTSSRIIFSLVTLLAFSSLLHTIYSFSAEVGFEPRIYYQNGAEHVGGGWIGGIAGYGLMKIFGPVGLIIIAALIFALYIVYFFANGKSTLARMLLFMLDKLSALSAKLKRKRRDKKAENAVKKEDARAPRVSEKHSSLYDDDFFAPDNGMSELKIDKLGIKETRSSEAAESFPHLQEHVMHKSDVRRSDYAEIFDDGDDEAPMDIEVEAEPETEPTEQAEVRREETTISNPESADEIFTKEFDPFDFALNAERAAEQGRRTREAAEMINEYAEPVKTSFSDDRLNEARRAADEEMKRAAEAEAQRRAAEAAREARIKELLREKEAERAKATYTSCGATGSASASYASESSNEVGYKPFGEARATSESSNDIGYKPFGEARATSESSNDIGYKPFGEARATNGSFNDVGYKPFDEAHAASYEAEHEANTRDELVLGRSILNPTPDYDEEDDEETAAGFDMTLGDDDEDGAPDVEPIPEEKQNPDVLAYRNMFTMFDGEEKAAPEAVIVTESEPLKPNDGEEDDEPPFDAPTAMRGAAEATASAPRQEKPKEEKPKVQDYSNYKAPPIDLLKKGATEIDENINEEITRNGEKLIDTLAQFNVRASIRSVDVGPRITRYEIVPAKGVRVNSVINLFDDISLNLAAEGIRMEAPIPGKSAIGVEIPNRKPQMVFLRDLLETDEFKNASSTTMACFGKDVTGNPVLGDIAKMPHMLIAGATGMGKSVCINSIMISMLYRARPDELKFIMIDPKMVEFNGYNGIPHLLIPVIIDVKQAAGALMWAVDQMEKRYEMFLEYNVRNLDGYNQKLRDDPSLGAPLPKIVIVIDELNDLMLQVRKPVEDLIMRIAQKARAAGIHLIIGTQRPSVDVITGVIKANIPSRIACKVSSFTDSKTILEQAGAEKLLNNGDMLFWPVGKPKPTRVQGAFVSDGEVERVMNFLKSQNKGGGYDEQAMEEINRAAQKCSKGGKGDEMDDADDGGESGTGYFNDPQFLEAVELAVKQGKIATSLIQRKIGVGYGKAAKFIDIMEEQGFVSEPNGQKPRDVLITKDEWHEILARRSLD